MPTTPVVPTSLVQVEVRTHHESGVPDVVLVAQSAADEPPAGEPPADESPADESPADESPAGEPPAEGRYLLGPGAAEFGVDEQWLTRNGVRASAGSVQSVPLPAVPPGDGSGENAATGRVRPEYGWLLGTGGGSPQQWRTAGAALVRAVSGRMTDRATTGEPGPDRVQVHLPVGTTADQAAALTLGCVVSSHRYRIISGDPPARVTAVQLIAPESVAEDEDTAPGDGDATTVASLVQAVSRAQILGRATGLARDLANTPSDVKDPAWLADTAARLAADQPGLRAVVRDERWLAEHGFGGVLAVGAGSVRPPRLLELIWDPGDAVADIHLVLVGKGITFDTGGISIKPADGMHLMRTDMSGGAAVIAATLAVAQLALPLRLTALVPCAENHVSGSAYRPGDVVRHVDGTTTEVTNTDAEGRMVLADALAHAVRTAGPTALVDVATLTGAMKISLGLRTGGLFATDPHLAERIRQAGAAVGEAWWEMPLVADYADDVRSEIADLRQCPPGPGAITAALFLREFTAGLPWAHLDIAGPARAEQSYDEVNPGGTGFATRTLIELACSFTR